MWRMRMRHGRVAATATTAVLGLAAPGLAWAHGSGKGLGAFWNGVLHPLVEPAQLLALLALGLWLALHRLPRVVEWRALLAGGGGFVLAALGAGLSGHDLAVADGGAPDHLLQALGLVMAVATAAQLAITDHQRAGWAWLVPPLCGLVTAAAALASPAGALRGVDALGWMGGVAAGTALVVGYSALGARWVTRRFAVGPLVPRVLASWLAASLLLVAALPLAGR